MNAKYFIILKLTAKRHKILTFIFRNNFSENTRIKIRFNKCLTSRDKINHDAFI
jgi:hypothetical protein